MHGALITDKFQAVVGGCELLSVLANVGHRRASVWQCLDRYIVLVGITVLFSNLICILYTISCIAQCLSLFVKR